MKLEIEVSESEIKDALQRHIRTAIADRINTWESKNYVKEVVQQEFDDAVQRIVKEVFSDHPRIREEVETAIRNKLKAQVTALMRGKK